MILKLIYVLIGIVEPIKMSCGDKTCRMTHKMTNICEDVKVLLVLIDRYKLYRITKESNKSNFF